MESDPRSGRPRLLVVGAGSLRRGVGAALSLAVAGLLAYSLWLDLPHARRLLRSQYVAYASYTPSQRARAFGDLIPMPMDIMDFWRSWLHAGDRYYIQMPPMPFSSMGDKRYIMRSIAHLYLLPAVETHSLRDATVVLTWDADPHSLPLHYASIEQAGQQPIYASRTAIGA